MNYYPLKPPTDRAPRHVLAVVHSVHDDRCVDVSIAGTRVNVDCLPGLILKPGYQVVISVWELLACITSVVGSYTEEQLSALTEPECVELKWIENE